MSLEDIKSLNFGLLLADSNTISRTMNDLGGGRHSDSSAPDSSAPTDDEKHPIDIYSIHESHAGRLVLDLAYETGLVLVLGPTDLHVL